MNGSAILIAAPGSGSGKTVISCGIMSALMQRGLVVAACKCGPDYIDPMFHREVLGVDSENLDLFFCEKDTMKLLYHRHIRQADITVVEGVMGYYDGMGMETYKGSSYDVATTLHIPTILLVPCKGVALSVLALIQGMVQFQSDSQIRGILLNRVNPMIYPKLKAMIEKGLAQAGYEIPVVGYIPEDSLFSLESRHLGLVTPREVEELRTRLRKAGEILKESVDLEGILRIAKEHSNRPLNKGFDDCIEPIFQEEQWQQRKQGYARIGIAKDEAFCFYYKDNLEFLEMNGCQLIPFSPLHDKALPEDLDGLLLGGGYPELYGERLERNESMRVAIKKQLEQKLPCLAECGGFMYLQETLEDEHGKSCKMVGAIPGAGIREKKPGRFGYIHIEAQIDGVFLKRGESVKGHEFHYWDTTENGVDCMAIKPDRRRSWPCIHMQGNLFAGYPHIHFYSNLTFANRFVESCRKKRREKE